MRFSILWALASATRLARIWAYSLWGGGQYKEASRSTGLGRTYGLVLDLLGLAALECDPVALVLQTLGGDQTLDLGSLGVGLRALLLGLDLATDDVLADLYPGENVIISPEIPHSDLIPLTLYPNCLISTTAVIG